MEQELELRFEGGVGAEGVMLTDLEGQEGELVP